MVPFREAPTLFDSILRLTLTFFLFFVFFMNAQGSPQKRNKGKAQNIIADVEKFLLEKKRESAINRVLQEFSALSSADKQHVYRIYLKASRLFYLDRSQQAFEGLLQAKKTEPILAQTRLRELILKEPHHLGLALEDVRLDIQNKNCKNGLEKTEQLRQRVQFDEEINLMQAFSLYCLEKLTSATLQRLKKDTYLAEKNDVWKTLEGLIQVKAAPSTAKAAAKGPQDVVVETSYPEYDYYLWKKSLSTKTPRVSAANTYLESCRSLTGKQVQEWSWDPFLCRRTAEVESDLAKLNKKSDSSQ